MNKKNPKHQVVATKRNITKVLYSSYKVDCWTFVKGKVGKWYRDHGFTLKTSEV